MLEKSPLTNTRPPLTAIAVQIEPSGFGFQGFTVPVVRSIAGTCQRV